MSIAAVSNSTVSNSATNTFAASSPSSETTDKPRFRVDLANAIALPALKVQELEPELKARLHRAKEAYYTSMFMYSTTPADNHPSELYAVVKRGNTVVGKMFNSGGSETPNNLAGLVRFGGPDEAGMHGPELAQYRAEKLAKAIGGTIEVADTAATQAEFNARPPREWRLDQTAYNAFMKELEAKIAQRNQANIEVRQALLVAQAVPADITVPTA